MLKVSEKEFDRAVQEALRAVPPEFRPHLENVMIEVRRKPDRAMLRELELPSDADDLLGLYVGTPLEDRGGGDEFALPLPDRILIFHDNLCEMCESWEELVEEIRITVLHEIGHHFGMDEDQLENLGYD